MNSVSCAICGAKGAPGARYCSICGNDLAIAIQEGTTQNESSPGPPSVNRAWVIGSAPVCDIVEAEATVSGRHCRLTSASGTYSIEDLGSVNGTYVNGQRIAGPQRVEPWQLVTLGRTVPFPWEQVLNRNDRGPSLPAPGTKVIRIGRSPDNDVVIDYPTISGYHARVLTGAQGAFIEDLGSMNGTAINAPDKKIRRAPLNPEDRVFFGSYPVPASRFLVLNETPAIGTQPHQLISIGRERTVVGRDPDCDFPLPYPSVSWRHAELIKTSRGIEVRDLKSLNGTFVDGERVTGVRLLQPGEVVSVGSISLELSDGGELQRRDYKGNVTIEVSELCVSAPGRKSDRLLEGVNLTVFPTELVALMGPSGAGKTTLLKTLNGYTVPAGGSVLFNGNNLYASFDTYRLELGYVPQDDIIHPLLTVSESLYFTARLRTDLHEREINDRIQEVLQTLDISGISGKLIGSSERKVISGGERKRVNIAMELICDPTVLFLDEPTSGLSSGDSVKVVKHLSALARGGKTIVLTIHQPSTAIYRLFDQLILVSHDSKEKLPAGMRPGPAKLIYYGPAYPDSLEFFNPEAVEELKRRAPGCDPGPELIFEGLEDSPMTSDEWQYKYNESTQKRLYADQRKGTVHGTERSSLRKGQRFQIGQLRSLVHRNLILKLRDRLHTGILMAQSPAFALLVYLAFSRLQFNPAGNGDWMGFTSRLASVHFLMVIAAIWFGCNNAVREVVGEWAIFEREQMAGLKIPLYVLSKFVVLAFLCAFQCFTLLAIIYYACGLRGPFWSFFGILLLNSLCGVGIGLCISAKCRTTDSAVASLPVVLLPVIVLAGGMLPLYAMSGYTQAIAMAIPSRWGYEANLLAEAGSRPVYAFNSCGSVMAAAAEKTRLEVEKIQRTCEDQARAQERRIRNELGPIAGEVMPAAQKKAAQQDGIQSPPAAPAPSVPAVDIAESVFPSSPTRPEFLKFLPKRSPFGLCAGVLGGMQTVLLLLCYWILRRKVAR
jgi:ABC-type multidrug transport system ATPase subunit/pSer/pThr/pTyr-binding forkhead associated (FHA) protein